MECQKMLDRKNTKIPSKRRRCENYAVHQPELEKRIRFITNKMENPK